MKIACTVLVILLSTASASSAQQTQQRVKAIETNQAGKTDTTLMKQGSSGSDRALNPQPIPPGKANELNPQPIPPGTVRALNPQPIPPGHQAGGDPGDSRKTAHKKKKRIGD
jgi:hypothetical protein